MRPMRRDKPFADGRGAALCLMLLVSACGPIRGPATPAGAVPDACGASRLAGFRGLPVAELDEQYLPQTVRLIRPGDAVTEDFNAARLNVDLDAADRIRGFWCG